MESAGTRGPGQGPSGQAQGCPKGHSAGHTGDWSKVGVMLGQYWAEFPKPCLSSGLKVYSRLGSVGLQDYPEDKAGCLTNVVNIFYWEGIVEASTWALSSTFRPQGRVGLSLSPLDIHPTLQGYSRDAVLLSLLAASK